MSHVYRAIFQRVRPTSAWRLFAIAALVASLATGAGALIWPQLAHADPCSAPANAIVSENCLPGTPSSVWDVPGNGDDTIQGFATDISLNAGNTVYFKVNTDAKQYTIDIFRMGYYGGNGARLVKSIIPSVSLPQTQPACLSDAATGLYDCGNWAISASWAVPSTAVSGIYFARLTRTDTGGASHIFFIVRNDASHSNILFQTSDASWEAYNTYGGNNLYTGNVSGTPHGRAEKVSYNRPFNTASSYPPTWVFNAEYPMVRWLEANGYDVSYFTDIDSDRNGQLIKNHKVFLSVGHDEYWSGGQRTNVEAARDAGVNLAFFSGNEAFWKTRYEASIDGSSTSYRTLVTYKETDANRPIDPQDPPTWTGSWADPRFSPPADGGRPQNALTGTLFMVNGDPPIGDAITVPSAYSKLRFWRNTAIASLASGATYTLPAGVLGFEWDGDVDNGFRPAGLMDLSSTTLNEGEVLQDYGTTYAPGTATHSLTLYRAPSGALVFGAGTIQWSWGLDATHDRAGTATDFNMQQATVNLFADMGAQPASLQSGLVAAVASTDKTPPTSTITSPANGATIQAGTTVTISGTSQDSGGGVVAGVEISLDGGTTWHPASIPAASGSTNWTYTWRVQTAGQAAIMSRAVDDSGNLETPSAGVNVTVQGPACPCSLWNSAATPSISGAADGHSVELGVKFRADVAGYITGLRFYKDTTNTGTHVGNLWDSAGNLLARVTFTNETASGWQIVSFANPVAIAPNTTYIVSYFAPNGHYALDLNYFKSGYDNTPLHALPDGSSGGNGVYAYGSSSSFPTTTNQQSNYWVDPLFTTTYNPSTEPPYIIAVTPSNGSTGVPIGNETGATVTATFSKAMDPTTVTSSTVSVVDATNTSVAGTVSYNNATKAAIFTPATGFQPGMTYSVTVKSGSGGVKDTSGAQMGADYLWSFSTAGPPTVVAVSPSSSTSNIPTTTTVTATFSEPMSATTVNANTFLLRDASNNPIAASVSYNPTTRLASLAPSAPLAATASYTATIKGGSSGVKDLAGNALAADYTWSFVVRQCPCTLWSTLTTPSITAADDGQAVELGVKFRSDISGYITGIRFYKGATNTGSHLGHLWTSSGTMLAEALFTNETASGWQTVTFDQPVAVSANTTYIASYYAPNGHYALDRGYFTTAYDNAPLHALADGSSGGDGVYVYGASAFPTVSYGQTNYWVDPIFATQIPPDTTPPTVTSVFPTSGGTGVVGGSVAATFSKAIDATTISASTFLLRDANNTAVAGSVTYTASTHTATFAPSVSLSAGTTYTATIKGGSSGVKDLAGNALAADYTWSFTVQACPCSLWNGTATPSISAAVDGNAVELGVKFRSDISGYITGISFYKGSGNTGTHVGHLWDSSGNLLATATFASETASGWQTVYFATPVAISANTTYIASYYAPTGHYALDRSYFATAYDNAPLHALADGTDGPNGVYLYGGGFPTSTYGQTNYWVDVIFTATHP